MSTERQQLEATIVGLEAQRALLGDATVDAVLADLRTKLASLVAAPADERPAQTLKQVTILFLDIVGSTKLSQHLDSEQISEVMDGALAQFAVIVAQQGGKVLQYAGDSVLAVFGADEAREDDPERAVRAGLALLGEGQNQGEQVRQKHGHDGFTVRVGVHTGGVLLGGGVDAEASIRGQPVNVAARMEQTAPPGCLRISHDTYCHVRGVFDVEPQPPLSVNGVDKPIATYLVQRAKPRAFRVATRGIEGVETRIVGREVELEQLQDAFKALVGGGTLASVTVVAEAGMGKSRLLYEFQNWAEARPEAFHFFQCRATPQTQSQPYGLLRDLLAWRLRIADSDSMEVAKQKIERGIVPLFTADDGDDMAQAHAHLLGHLIGLDFAQSKHIKGILNDARQIRNRAFHAAAQMFRRMAARGDTPIVLLLDDLHWADDGSLDFLDFLFEANRDVPMLMLALTRPTLFERRPDWPGIADAQRIDLFSLDERCSHLLADELLQKLHKIPAELREVITGRAEGNPFYMEELVKMLVDQGAIDTKEGRWSVNSAKLRDISVPQTLTGVLQARLDNLKTTEKRALQQASVIGFVFWDQALAAIDARATEALPGLTQRALVVPLQEASLEGVREYAFHHQILHQVTYDTVLKQMRRECHAKTAAWLSGLSGARSNDYPGATAKHFESAGDHANACEFYTRAAEKAAGRYAQQEALGYVAEALALIVADEHLATSLLRWRILDVRERTLDFQGKRAEQHSDLDALELLADRLDDDRRRSQVHLRRGDIAFRTADFAPMERAARQAMALAERAGDEVLRLRAQRELALALVSLGDVAAGKALTEGGLAAARAQGLRRNEAMFLNVLSLIAERQGDVMAMLQADRQQLPIFQELGDRRNEANALGNLGLSWLNLGQHAQARQYLEPALRLARAIGDYVTQPYALVNLSQLALWQCDESQALAHARAALDMAMAVRDRLQEATALCWLGSAELALGHHERAVADFERAYAVAQTIGHAQRHDAVAGLARVALAQGDVATALRRTEDLLSHLADGGTLEGTEAPRLIQLTCHRVLARADDPRAAVMLANAHTELLAQAATITDVALRKSFLNNIPEHREIVTAWATNQAASAGGH